MHDCEVISKTRASCFVRVSKHRETIKALGRFICVCFYHPGGSFSLAHKNPGLHGADLLSFSGALCHPLPPFQPHQVVVFVTI